MALADDFQSIGEKLITDCEERLEKLAELRDYVKRFLEQASADRTEAAREMWDTLHEDRLNRLNEISELLNEYIQDRTQAEKSWSETLKVLNKLRSK